MINLLCKVKILLLTKQKLYRILYFLVIFVQNFKFFFKVFVFKIFQTSFFNLNCKISGFSKIQSF